MIKRRALKTHSHRIKKGILHNITEVTEDEDDNDAYSPFHRNFYVTGPDGEFYECIHTVEEYFGPMPDVV